MGDIQAALRRIEAGQGEALAELRNFRREMDEAKAHHKLHEEENRADFSALHQRVSKVREDMDTRFVDNTEDRQRHLNEQDEKLDGLLRDRNVAKGAGWAIIAVLGSLVTLIGAAVLSALEGLIHIKLG